jgi:biotin carboxyl carrier protein
MPGVVLSVNVRKGERVEEGALLCTLEAMKMEHEVRAAAAGTVERVFVEAGERVEKEAPLAEIRS